MMNGLRLLKEGKVWAYRDKVFVTDLLGSSRTDAILPICHENLFLAERMYIPDGGTVLDLCTGSGMLAICAADKARMVVGTDVNPRALRFAKFNARLNRIEDKIEWKLGDLFAPVKGMRFDVILANPPFEPTPAGWTNYLHSDGGEDGLSIVRRILAQVSDHLSPSGSFQMITWLAESSVHILDEIRSIFGAENVNVESLGEFPLQAYRERQMKRSELLRGQLGRSVPETTESIFYLYIHARAGVGTFYNFAEVSGYEKAVPVARLVV
jgi:HemK-related putative methylase